MGFPPLLSLFDPRDPASQFWVGLGGLVVAIATVAISVVRQLLKSGGGAKCLTYAVLASHE